MCDKMTASFKLQDATYFKKKTAIHTAEMRGKTVKTFKIIFKTS